MIHLMIRHKIRPGKLGEAKGVVEQGIRIWQRHGCNVLGVWTNWIGGETDEIMHIYQFKSFAEYEEIDAKVHADPEWPDFRNKTTDVTMARSTELLRPTAFSPLR